ncbi:hypothetical protein BDF21DRAFT_450811 [Thamnidium elegans]|nr:hypothetical protein BDF21DRAFT_450811 [Thamnidium elegans]
MTKKKCPDNIAKRMRECMNVIHPKHSKKVRNNHSSCRNYSCDPNVELMAHLSLDNTQIPQPQENHSPENHRNSFESYDIGDILAMELFKPLPINPSIPPTAFCINSSTPMQDFMKIDNQSNVTSYGLNNISPFDQQQQNMNIDPNFYALNMNTNQLNSNVIATPSPPIDKALPDTVSPSLQSNLPDMPSRPNPPSITDGPQYFEPSPNFRVSFESVDADYSNFITFEELAVFLVNKDGTGFTNEAVMMIMGMFDQNKDYMIDVNEFPDMLTFIKNWDCYFKHLDADKTGTLDFREMNVAIKSLGLTSLSDTFITELIQKYVRPDDKRIHFDNFIVACVTLCRYEEGHRFMKQLFGNVGFNTDLERFIAGSIYQM